VADRRPAGPSRRRSGNEAGDCGCGLALDAPEPHVPSAAPIAKLPSKTLVPAGETRIPSPVPLSRQKPPARTGQRAASPRSSRLHVATNVSVLEGLLRNSPPGTIRRSSLGLADA